MAFWIVLEEVDFHIDIGYVQNHIYIHYLILYHHSGNLKCSRVQKNIQSNLILKWKSCIKSNIIIKFTGYFFSH